MKNVQVLVEDWPDPKLMADLPEDPDSIPYGLFIGTPLPEKHFGDWGELPALIYIWQKPLEEDFPDPEELERQIEITLVHEIAHYMGIDEETLEQYGYE